MAPGDTACRLINLSILQHGVFSADRGRLSWRAPGSRAMAGAGFQAGLSARCRPSLVRIERAYAFMLYRAASRGLAEETTNETGRPSKHWGAIGHRIKDYNL